MLQDEEWQDYEDESVKDYSGLRIHNLQIRYNYIDLYAVYIP